MVIGSFRLHHDNMVALSSFHYHPISVLSISLTLFLISPNAHKLVILTRESYHINSVFIKATTWCYRKLPVVHKDSVGRNKTGNYNSGKQSQPPPKWRPLAFLFVKSCCIYSKNTRSFIHQLFSTHYPGYGVIGWLDFFLKWEWVTSTVSHEMAPKIFS